jgi:hypothetical protein
MSDFYTDPRFSGDVIMEMVTRAVHSGNNVEALKLLKSAYPAHEAQEMLTSITEHAQETAHSMLSEGSNHIAEYGIKFGSEHASDVLHDVSTHVAENGESFVEVLHHIGTFLLDLLS